MNIFNLFLNFNLLINLNFCYSLEYKINIYPLFKKNNNQFITKNSLNYKNNFNPSHTQGLIFEGGGTRAFTYQGVIKYLEEIDKIKDIKYLAGTSAGAITASLLAFGFTSKEIEDIIWSIQWSDLINRNIALNIKDIYQLSTSFGVYNGENIQNYLEILFQKKINIQLCTFKQLYDRNGIYLRLGVCCINDGSFRFLDYKSTPNMPISIGVRASSSIPLLITTTLWDNNIYIDGAILGNLPIKAFPDKKCLAFDLVSDDDKQKKKTINNIPNNLLDFIFTLFNILFNASQNENGYTIPLSNNISLIEIYTSDIGLLDFELNKKKINKLFKNGYLSIKNVFNYSYNC